MFEVHKHKKNIKKLKVKLQGVLLKSISNFEGQYPTFSFKENHQKYPNITP